MNTLLFQFAYLQILDFLTTAAFLGRGVQEANPIITRMMMAAQSPLEGLLLVKIAGLALGMLCWRMGKAHLLQRINVAFAILVVWNVVALLVSAGSVT